MFLAVNGQEVHSHTNFKDQVYLKIECTVGLRIRGGLLSVIPKQIHLTNFLSYREASLDFEGIHVACIAGPNGAGKSSLLEAMAWAIWGQSRVATDDDIIHQGQIEARVTFVFIQGHQVYRVIRSRHRIQGSGLEFQIQTQSGYRVLTQRGVRATQQLICRHLKIDYDTFVNSAYLRQGRADDFMLKRPSERKQILADLLKLDQYDRLADQAREHLRQAKAEVALRQTQIEELTQTIAAQQTMLAERATIQGLLQLLEQRREALQLQLQNQRQQAEQKHHYQQQLQLHQQQYEHLAQLHQQTAASLTQLKTQLEVMQDVLDRRNDIEAGLAHAKTLEAEEADLDNRFQQYQRLQAQKEQLTQQLNRETTPLYTRLQRLKAQQESLTSQLQALNLTLQKADEVTAARQDCLAARRRLQHLDALQLQTEPLLQRRRQIQAELQQEQTRLQTRLENLDATMARLQQQHTQCPKLEANAQEVAQTLDYLERRRAYQEQVREKGQERRQFMETLQANLRTYEAQLVQVDQKLKLLHHPEATCPLCDRTLDTHHRTLVEDRHRSEQQDLRQDIILTREQLAVTEREVQVLRQEYRALETELECYAPVLQQQGHLEAQLSTHSEIQKHIKQLRQDRQSLQDCLHRNHFREDLQTELRQLEHSLAQLAYDERDHALARGQVDRLRWADIKHHELTQARQRQSHLEAQQEDCLARIAEVEQQLKTWQHSELHQQLDNILQTIANLNYDASHHQQVRQALRQTHTWRLQQQDLDRAKQTVPQHQAKLAALISQQQQQQQDLQDLTETIHQLTQQLHNGPDISIQIHRLESNLQDLHQQRDSLLAQLGALQHQQQQLETLQTQLQQQQQQLSSVRQQQRVYQELAQAFGHNGIPTMMIENLLPQLEAETNRLLGRLSAHQLHVQFVTQRASKRRQGKFIDTLDILIADASGTRSYETYSGGEAFRVNFAIRLALARLLAQRSGLALKLLIIDEGFGTQDQQGCERLIGAINAISDDFACVLAVTHIPHFREAFQTRIDVAKGQQGSWVVVSS
jgi:exonuclease SbcC